MDMEAKALVAYDGAVQFADIAAAYAYTHETSVIPTYTV